jgi:hypothetical protein
VSNDEWFGEPHTLIVHEVTPPDGPFDDGDLDYEIEHPPSCTKTVHTYEFACADGESPTVEEWDCDVFTHETEAGLAGTLRCSGTPVTEPGTYQIQSWGRKISVWDAIGGYEYDGGVGLMDPVEATT